VRFLLIDLDLALTFMDVANVTGIEETMYRNHANARIAFDSVLRLLKRLKPSTAEQLRIDDKLAILKVAAAGSANNFEPF
jgi:hypothetical protein